MNAKTLISLTDGVISNPLRRLAAPASFELRQGECIAVVGPNGSGKSTLLKMITGGFYLREGSLKFSLSDEPYRAIRTVEFDNAYSTTETQYYHQQRWQAFEREASPLAGELLSDGDDAWRMQLFGILSIRPLLEKEIITLSSGELRRFSIARALLHRPQVLILESPFVGLDPPTRDMLCTLLEQLRTSLGISIVMTLTDVERIPAIVTHAYLMDAGRIAPKMKFSGGSRIPPTIELSGGNSPKPESAGAALNGVPALCRRRLPPDSETLKDSQRTSATQPEIRVGEFFHPAPEFETVVEMRSINISYGERQIFRNLNWKVRSGEKWNVTGPNGSGKSTLLSLVNADNPRAYSLDITLFDRRRGTGESIWDIKRHIGYLSSEMHSSFKEDITALEILRSGANDNTRIDDDTLLRWLELFGAESLANRSYLTLSSGEQRYVLLIRAFVKDPDLLILDEPFQGLDPAKRHRAAAVIEAFCQARNKTLIFVTHYIDEVPGIVTHTLQL